jgi:hypothetical protein
VLTLQTAKIPVGIVKRHVARGAGSDILDTLISPYYIESYTHPDLQKAVAPLSLTRVILGRYYPTEKIAVDFETPPAERPFNVDAKRRWCHTQGIAYVPVYTRDFLTAQDFIVRLDAARAALAAPVVAAPSAVVSATPTAAPPALDAVLQDPAVQTALVDAGTAVILAKWPKIKTAKLDHHRAAWMTETLKTLQAEITAGEVQATVEAVLAWVHARAAVAGR